MEAKVASPLAHVGLQPSALVFSIFPMNVGIQHGTYLLIQHRRNGMHTLAVPYNHVQQPWGNASPKERMKMEGKLALA